MVYSLCLEALLESSLLASAEHVSFTVLVVRACDYDSGWLRPRSCASSINCGDFTQASMSEGWGRSGRCQKERKF